MQDLEMLVWNSCVQALGAAGFVGEAFELEELGSVAKFLELSEKRVQACMQIVNICKEHAGANISYVGRVNMCVASEESVTLVYVGMNYDAALNAVKGFDFDSSAIPEWQYYHVNKSVETWYFGKLESTYHLS